MGYYFYILTENKVFIAIKILFLQIKFLIHRAIGRHVELEEERQPNTPEVETSTQQEVVEPKQIIDHELNETKSVRIYGIVHQEPKRYGFLIDECFLVDFDEPIKLPECHVRF